MIRKVINLKIGGTILTEDSFIKRLTRRISRKQALTSLILVAVLGLLLISYKVNEINTRAFAVYYGEVEVGSVREKEEAKNILTSIKDDLTNTYGVEIVLNDEMNFEDTHLKTKELTCLEEIKDGIKSNLTFLVCGYKLLVDDKAIGATKTKEEIKEVLEAIKKPYMENSEKDREIKTVEFLEDVKIEEGNIPLNEIMKKEALLKQIETGREESEIHIVEVGESLWTIAKIHSMDIEELEEANPDKEPDSLQIGDEITLIVPKSLVTITTTEEVKYKEEIEYEVKVENDENMYKTEKKVKVEGKRGETEFLAKLIKHNGVVVEEEVLEEKIVEEAINEIIVKGSKEVPRTIATGSFLMPTRGSISSRYGMRNGRMHRGLDIAASSGTAIKAADGGKVVFTGRRGAYGNLVEVDHGNGYLTRYAHCSTINVKNGQRVAKGDVIALVGNTGRSTGPHLHFEVIKNGANQNPASYLN